ncbi:hypothetical protein EYC80_010859 [Monilinia laxa]|uniref:4a-hydroxytetrahydrobiopterin dehydratase n=1 Tax=Monilinia laxa TaxID=61186 RepID=A0A5N6JPF5_MONLA|nr:hypothetical protein EYC80_010859 [Monilinia laxa]
MKLSIRPVLYAPFKSAKAFPPHPKPLPKILTLPPNPVLQVRAFKLPTSTFISKINSTSKEKIAPSANDNLYPSLEHNPPKEKGILNSKFSAPTDQTFGSFKYGKSEVLPKKENHDIKHLKLKQPLDSVEAFLKENGGKWTLTADKMGIERIFRFKGFKDSWNFLNDIAARCKQEKHHPEWVNIYNMVFIRWTTHVPRGLTSKDLLMASFCDAQAVINNEKIDHSQDSNSTELSDQMARSEKLLKYASQVKSDGGNK